MSKKIYLIRHCQATGQPATAELTEVGLKQAEALAKRLNEAGIQRIISSPYRRAIQSIEPFAFQQKIVIETDERLIERKLCEGHLPDWFEKLQETFIDLDLKLTGGESSREAMARGVALIQELIDESVPVAVVTHGNLLALILKHYQDEVDFDFWKNLQNPDIWLLELASENVQIKRL